MEDAVCLFDRNGKIIMCNDAHCRMLGYRKEEIVGTQPPFQWIAKDNEGKLKRAFKVALNGKSLKYFMMTWYQKNHSRRIVSLALSPLWRHSKGIVNIICTVRDVTDVQYAEDLRKTNERLGRLILDVRRKAVQLETLAEVNSLVLTNVSVSHIFRTVTVSVKKLVEHDLAGIYVYDIERKSFIPHTLSKKTSFSRKLSKFPLPLGKGIIGTAAALGKMVVANNAQFDPRSKYPKGMKPEKEHFIAVPLKGRGTIFGVLIVARNRDPEFIEEESMLVKSFAEAVTVALENARLFQELKKLQTKIPAM